MKDYMAQGRAKHPNLVNSISNVTFISPADKFSRWKHSLAPSESALARLIDAHPVKVCYTDAIKQSGLWPIATFKSILTFYIILL